MRSAWFVVVCILIVGPVPMSAGQATDFAFHAPATIAGEIVLTGPGNHGLAAGLLTDGRLHGQEVVVETKDVVGTEFRDVIAWQMSLIETPWETAFGATANSSWTISAEQNWGLRAWSADSSFSARDAILLNPTEAGEGFEESAKAPAAYPQWRAPLLSKDGGPTALLRGVDSATLRGSFVVEFFATTLTNVESSQVIQSGPLKHSTPVQGNDVSISRYVRATVENGTLELRGKDILHAGLTSSVNVRLDDGLATFPLASDAEAKEQQTWHIEGPAVFLNIKPTDSSTYGATATWHEQNIRIDGEGHTPISGSAIAASSLGLLATVLLAIKAFPTAAALLTRLPPEKALENANRKALYAYILDHPGATFREVLRGTGIPAGTARHHLSVLCRSNMIVEHGHRSTLRFFENHGRFDATWQSIVLLREHPLSKVYQWLKDHPGSIQRELLEHAEAKWQWSRSTTQHRLARLIDGGLVDVQHMGRRKMYEVVDPRDAEPIPLKSSWT